MSVRQQRKQQSHAKILAAATRSLRQRGVGGTGVAEVMGEAGLTVGGFYAHFSSKDALVDEAIRRIGQLNRARLFGRLDERPPSKRALLVLKRYLSADNRDDEDGCPLPSIASEVATTAQGQREALRDVVEAFAGELMKHGASRSTALGVVALGIGALTLARALSGTPLSDELLSAAKAFGARALPAGAPGTGARAG